MPPPRLSIVVAFTMGALMLVTCLSAFGAAKPGANDPSPDFTTGGKPPLDKSQDWTLGPTGARGWIFARKLETTEARQIFVTQVDSGSPAAGLLAAGDVILGLNGEPFASDARIALAKAITEAEKDENQGRLGLLRWRAGQRANVELQLEVMGTYSATAPYDCRKSARIFDQGCRRLAERMKTEDSKKRLDPIVRSLNALALLASDRPEYLPLVRQEAQWAAEFSIPDSEGFQSWYYGYVNTFLAEYVLATNDRLVEPGLKRLALALARGQSAVGTWGHSFAYPNGRLQGYGAMNQPGLSCTISMVLARQAGVQEPALDQAIARSERFLSFYVGKGCIPYGDHHPWMQTHEDNGKCGFGSVMFDLLGNAKGAEFFSRMSTASHGGERDTGHTGNFFNLLWSLPGISRSGPHATGAWMQEFAWYMDFARRWDGTFLYQGEPGEKEAYAGWDSTGAYLLGYALPLKKVYLTGKKPSVATQLDAAAARSIIADGRDWSPATKAAAYSRRSSDELFAGLTNWSPIVRERSAMELVRRGGDPVPQLLTLLKSKDLNARYGACQALAAIGKRGASAVPVLRETLRDDDLWLRIKAAEALAQIGEAARPALPDLLKFAVETSPEADPRGMVQRYVGFALFSSDRALDVRGLLAGSLDGVDRQQLFPAVEAVLRNDDGRVRGAVGDLYKRLSFEEIKPLLPAIQRAIVEPAPSGEMFADNIRLEGLELLAKYRIEEGMALCVQTMDIERWGARARIPRCLKALEAYGAAAQSQLPELRKLEPAFKRKGADLYDELSRAIGAIQAAKDTGPLCSLRTVEQPVPARP